MSSSSSSPTFSHHPRGLARVFVHEKLVDVLLRRRRCRVVTVLFGRTTMNKARRRKKKDVKIGLQQQLETFRKEIHKRSEEKRKLWVWMGRIGTHSHSKTTSKTFECGSSLSSYCSSLFHLHGEGPHRETEKRLQHQRARIVWKRAGES